MEQNYGLWMYDPGYDLSFNSCPNTYNQNDPVSKCPTKWIRRHAARPNQIKIEISIDQNLLPDQDKILQPGQATKSNQTKPHWEKATLYVLSMNVRG